MFHMTSDNAILHNIAVLNGSGSPDGFLAACCILTRSSRLHSTQLRQLERRAKAVPRTLCDRPPSRCQQIRHGDAVDPLGFFDFADGAGPIPCDTDWG